MPMINELDNIITKSMIRAEKNTEKPRYNHPWYSSLVLNILTLSLWKSKISILCKNRDKQHVVNKLLKKIKSFTGQQIPIQTDS